MFFVRFPAIAHADGWELTSYMESDPGMYAGNISGRRQLPPLYVEKYFQDWRQPEQSAGK